MDKIEKLLRTLSKKDRAELEAIIFLLAQGMLSQLNITKITGTEVYRVRFRRYRILFKKEKTGAVIYDIRIRNEHTYKRIAD